jgi:hypothetical protein
VGYASRTASSSPRRPSASLRCDGRRREQRKVAAEIATSTATEATISSTSLDMMLGSARSLPTLCLCLSNTLPARRFVFLRVRAPGFVRALPSQTGPSNARISTTRVLIRSLEFMGVRGITLEWHRPGQLKRLPVVIDICMEE